MIVRLYESNGGRATATARFGFPIVDATVTDLLERPLTDESVTFDTEHVELSLRPFQIITLRLAPTNT